GWTARVPLRPTAADARSRDRALVEKSPPGSGVVCRRVPARADQKVRCRALARGSQLLRRVAGRTARYPSPLRHALQPSPAADEFRVQPIANTRDAVHVDVAVR